MLVYAGHYLNKQYPLYKAAALHAAAIVGLYNLTHWIGTYQGAPYLYWELPEPDSYHLSY